MHTRSVGHRFRIRSSVAPILITYDKVRRLPNEAHMPEKIDIQEIIEQKYSMTEKSQLDQRLDQFFGFKFSVNGEDLQVKVEQYPIERSYSGVDTLGLVFKILRTDHTTAGEVVAYLYSYNGVPAIVVQYTENKTKFKDQPIKGLIATFAVELLKERVIKTWNSSSELNQKSRGMYLKLQQLPELQVVYESGRDFRNKDPAFGVSLK